MASQLRLADGKVVVNFMEVDPPPGQLVRFEGHEYRVDQGPQPLELVEHGPSKHWLRIVTVQRVDADKPAHRRAEAVRG